MKRLLVATLAALGTLWLLGFLVSLIGLAGVAVTSPVLNQTDPVSLLVTTLAMGVGGYLDGKRFIGVAPALMVLLWFAIVLALYQITKPMQPDGLPHLLAYNRMQIVMSLLAAGAGAAIGAWLKSKRSLLQAA
jgi:hypothetical protein